MQFMQFAENHLLLEVMRIILLWAIIMLPEQEGGSFSGPRQMGVNQRWEAIVLRGVGSLVRIRAICRRRY